MRPSPNLPSWPTAAEAARLRRARTRARLLLELLARGAERGHGRLGRLGATAAAAGGLLALVGRARRSEQLAGDLRAAAALQRLLVEGATAATVLEAATTVARVLGDALKSDLGVVFSYPDDHGGGIEVATVGMPAEVEQAVRRAVRRAVRTGFAGSRGWVAARQAREPIFEESVRPGAERPGGIVEVTGLQSYASLPLRGANGRVGHVLAGYLRPHRFAPWERTLVARLATEAGLVLDSARLREVERAQRALLADQASHDPLTGLANRRAFAEALDDALLRSAAEGRRLALLLVDLDRFKEVNDSLGHHAGDALLVEVADRLRRRSDDISLAARLGGDEFALLLEDADASLARATAVALAKELEEVGELEGATVTVRASIGIALHPEHGQTREELVRQADAAMYAAKRTGSGLGVASTPGPTVPGPEAYGLLGELRAALEAGELVCHYQPKVSLHDGSWVGAEALVRWPHPTRGLLLPERFLPVAARAGLLAPLGRHVLERTLAQAAAWRAAGAPLPVAVNLAADDLCDPQLLERLREGLEAAGLPPDQLTLELSESSIAVDVTRAVAVLRAVRLLGVRISLDDFGADTSCLAHLDALPIDELKLHRSFVQRGLAEGDGTVLAAVVRLGHELGLEVVAEGIDAAELAARVAELGCDLAQGYHLGPPLPAGLLLAGATGGTGKTLNTDRRADVGALAGRGAPR